MKNLGRRWFGNSLVNLFGGLATAGVNVLLPALVVKHLSSEEFSVWNLALQIVVYVNLLSLGMQTATARAVAHSAEQLGDGVKRLPVVVRAARSISRNAAGIALFAVAGLVVGYPLLFPKISPELLYDFRLTLLFFGCSGILQILAQVAMGVFQGLHRNIVFVSVQVVTRLFTVLMVWVGVSFGQSLVVLAILMASASSLIYPAMQWVFHRVVPWAGEVRLVELDRACRHDLLKYCGTLSVWSVSMLLVNSVGIVIVGRLDFLMAGPYAIAMTAASVLVGLLSAGLSPLMTTAAGLYATESTRGRLPRLLLKSTWGAILLLNIITIFVAAFYPVILEVWVGKDFIVSAGPMLVVLVGAHCLRNIAAPYSLMLLATGLHRQALTSAILEGVANLLASIVFGLLWGAIGVALGTLLGAIVGIVGTLWMNTGRTPELTPVPHKFILQGVILPMLIFAPLQIYFIGAMFI